MTPLDGLDVGTIVTSKQRRAPGDVPKASGLVVDAGIDATGDEYVVILDMRKGSHVVTARKRDAQVPRTLYCAGLRRMAVADIATVDDIPVNGKGIAEYMRYGAAALAQLAASISDHRAMEPSEYERDLIAAALFCFEGATTIGGALAEAGAAARAAR